MARTLLEMTVDIIKAQSATTSMNQEEIAASLQETFRVLQILQQNEQSGTIEDEKKEALSLTPDESIQKTKIICLECGQEFRTLSPKHLASHGLTGRSYRQKYGMKVKQPLCAQAITAKRKKDAQKRGIPENLKKSIAEKKEKSASKKAAKAQQD